MAILDFFNNDLRLSRRLELEDAAGHIYSELPDELKEIFLAYPLTFDQFESAAEDDVREYFRRINSFTAPLNAEEQRHAQYQGPMKWFILDLVKAYGDVFVNLDVLTQRKTIRMQDAKLLAEIVHALLNGIQTTSKTKLDQMYHSYERGDTVEDEEALREAVDEAMDVILGIQAIHSTSMMKMHVFYSLVLAVIRVRRAWPTLLSVASEPTEPSQFSANASANLLVLADALDEPDQFPDFKEFTKASAGGTNVESARKTRVRWLTRALADPTF
jgi:hypothetical protein